MKGELLIVAGIFLIMIGFMLVFLGTIISAFSQPQEGNVEAGGVIMIGPIPIVFGTKKGATIAMILAVVLMALWIILALLRRA
ncbi:hypothetical protein A3L04_06290 [Thermococcus chitonophagus]|uniref:TIGR00304 family protein n=1 Tax=Thermococcus chitonophagus TaxID=54262 RepID=A0A160VRW7_9EURY|nr:TIGR00304 family protein [Thermococcus chitonophagus]ASJ16707.1 hypothetical protein A3L04_06290 [Thermococcus chitonophagus]CUX77369.1 hypothetical protein CHITON_0590 [Thermococcus chitonophagus]